MENEHAHMWRLVTLACLLVALVSRTEQVTNFALNQPAYQYGIWRPEYDVPSNVVDGNPSRDLTGVPGHCSHSGDHSTVMPWWTVKLAKWIRLTSFRSIGRDDDGAENRDAGYSYFLGSFWNDSLPSVVSTTSMLVDPLQGQQFSIIYTHTTYLHTLSSLNPTMSASDVLVGRYFAVQNANVNFPLMLCEVEVYGDPSVLSGSNTLAIGSASASVSQFNSSILTDDRDETCLSFFGLNSPDTLVLRSLPATSGKLRVLVLMRGNVRIDSGNDQSCIPGLALRVAMRRLQGGSLSADYVCQSVETRTYGVTSLYSFKCECTSCMSEVSVWLKNNGNASVGTVDVCEVLVFAV